MNKILAVALTFLLVQLVHAEGAPPERKQSYEAVNCQNAPEGSVLKLPAPAASYALVFCSPSGHAVAAVDGYVWFPVKRPGQPFFFSAAAGSKSGPARAYFVDAASRTLAGEAADKSHKMLEVGYQISQQFSQIVQLDVLSAEGLLYNLFFYIEGGRPVYVLGCVDRCNTSVLLREYSLEEAKALLQR